MWFRFFGSRGNHYYMIWLIGHLCISKSPQHFMAFFIFMFRPIWYDHGHHGCPKFPLVASSEGLETSLLATGFMVIYGIPVTGPSIFTYFYLFWTQMMVTVVAMVAMVRCQAMSSSAVASCCWMGSPSLDPQPTEPTAPKPWCWAPCWRPRKMLHWERWRWRGWRQAGLP